MPSVPEFASSYVVKCLLINVTDQKLVSPQKTPVTSSVSSKVTLDRISEGSESPTSKSEKSTLREKLLSIKGILQLGQGTKNKISIHQISVCTLEHSYQSSLSSSILQVLDYPLCTLQRMSTHCVAYQ